jgi:hypothetical protein
LRFALLLATVGGTGAVGSDFLSSTPDLEALQRRLLEWPDEIRPVPWLSMMGADYYIVLPDIDNWSMYGELRTAWTKIRIKSIPRVGHTSVVLDLHDFRYSTSNGQSSLTGGENVSSVEWGVAADCRGDLSVSEMRINLTGTPFRYDPVYATANGVNAHGQVSCSADSKHCTAACGGSCGSCGLGMAGSAHHALLHVVDQEGFDHALRALLQAALDVVHNQSSSSASTDRAGPPSANSSAVATLVVGASQDTGAAGMNSLVILLLLFCVAISGCVGILIGGMIRRRRAYGEFKDNTDPVPPPETFGGALQASGTPTASA